MTQATSVDSPSLERNVHTPKSELLSFGEKALFALLFSILLLLKWLCVHHYRVDSDEPQHLHTVWAWCNGQLPYRDLFDNHTPLFQWLCSPLFKALGERADIIFPMRLAMVPLYAFDLWCVYRIGLFLHSRRAGLWAAVLAGLAPKFFLVSTEFRTDDLWTAAWLGFIAWLVVRKLTPARAFIAGLIAGATLGVSMKTSLLLFTLAAAGGIALGIRAWFGQSLHLRKLACHVASGLLGLCVVPACIVYYFYEQGAWPSFMYCVFQHNIVPGLLESPVPRLLRPFLFPTGLILFSVAGYRLIRKDPTSNQRAWAAALLLSAMLYITALWGYWPVLSAEDYEPFIPLVAASLIPIFFYVLDNKNRLLAPRICGVAAVLTCVWLVKIASPFTDKASAAVQLTADALRLTRPGDYVMDGKCESIFRKRPFYFVLETMTDARYERGEIRDDIPEKLIATSTPIARTMRLYPRALAFVRQNYIGIHGGYKLLGKHLGDLVAGEEVEFEIAVPAKYEAAGDAGRIPGELDGQPLTGARWLAIGKHRFRAGVEAQHAAMVWADAVDRKLYPAN